MCNSLKKEDNLLQIRDKLRKEFIKLWVEPYYDENGPIFEELKKLAQDYSGSLQIPIDCCYECLLELQANSLNNLKQNNVFKESGLATIKIKVLNQYSPPRVITKELMLSLRASDLKDLLSKEINIAADRLKLISSGKVLADSLNLSSQGIKNGHLILAITLTENPNDVENQEKQINEMEGVKSDSRLLANDDQYMQIEDQFGNAIKIPPEEKKALIVALALHEKGRAALKREDYSKALIYFLETDEEFSICNSQLLNTVDNYALLNLDIAWCYLCLQSVSHLPEAFERLKKCEEKFHKSYGSNLERLIAVKGASGNESALFMRLHLLQAIVLYHKNMREEALQLLKKAQQELEVLKVDENSIMTLVELGYTVPEARLALRANQGDINRAANFIKENRDKRSDARKKTRAEEILMKKKIKLGKCADGKQYVDPNFLNMLVNMGFNKEAARIALQAKNNIISDSIQYIHENPMPGPSQSRSHELLSFIEDLVPELEAAGFDPRMAKLALHKHMGDITKAFEDLLANNGIVEGDLSILNMSSESLENFKKTHEEKEQALKRLTEDLSMVDDDHLDLTLEKEEVFLKQYLSLLENN